MIIRAKEKWLLSKLTIQKQKSNNKQHEDLIWFGPNMAYVHEEKTWENFINKLDTKKSILPLDLTRVFIFPFNIGLNYKIISSFYAPSPYSSLSWLPMIFFKISLVFSTQQPTGLQHLFMVFYITTLIWTMRWSWSSDAWRILFNPMRRWSSWSRRIKYP